MREHKYRNIPVPTHLNSNKIQTEFDNNIKTESYSSGSKYNDNAKIVKNTLKQIYHYKCAFCEASLKNSYGEIEHYRPKKSSNLTKCDSSKSYYWLAFAWDNLLPSCKMCNISKSNCFDIYKIRANYNKDTLISLHSSLQKYHDIEKPKLLHPEIDKFEKYIHFQRKGKIITDNERVKYTIKICNLNRKQLSELREEIITDHTNKVKKMFRVLIEMKPKLSIQNMLKLMSISFNEIFEKSKIEKQFSAVSLDIHNNFEIFLDRISILSNKDKQIILQLWKIYKKNK